MDPQAHESQSNTHGRDSSENQPQYPPHPDSERHDDARQSEGSFAGQRSSQADNETDIAERSDDQAEAGEPAEGVESGTFEGKYSDEAVKAVFVEKLNRGETVFTEDQMRGLAHALGLEDEIDPAFFGQNEVSPTAGSTPATGSGGVPYRDDAGTDETNEFADSLRDRDSKEDEDRDLSPSERSHSRRLQEAGVGSKNE